MAINFPTSATTNDIYTESDRSWKFNGTSWDGLPTPSVAGNVAYTPAGTGAVTTDVETKLRETVSVTDFGVEGDGVADDTTKIQAAIDYASTSGMVLHFPENMEMGFTNISSLVSNGVFVWSGSPKFKQLATRDANTNALEIGGGGSITTSLTSGATVGDNTINLVDASSVAVGDLIRLRSSRLMFGDHRFDHNNAFGQLVKARECASCQRCIGIDLLPRSIARPRKHSSAID